MPVDFLPILILLILSALMSGGMVFLSHLFGRKEPNPSKLSPYECGIPPFSDARLRFSVKFFLVAMLFIIFDFEGVTIYPWAVIFRELSLFGLVEMGVFLGILLIGLLYIWRKGALQWD
ncbi:MAG: NADH-quinone oxidoreductase subunit A [Candidatus Aminicenantes bacterium]|nr:NADH-quinone oxidoreductase subunit A [Candidatus Aminicenantes bacterium]MDH5714567.1 NADH-quinone oxidoreductase subunit A [Candidatus Aminicenantes bacterium]